MTVGHNHLLLDDYLCQCWMMMKLMRCNYDVGNVLRLLGLFNQVLKLVIWCYCSHVGLLVGDGHSHTGRPVHYCAHSYQYHYHLRIPTVFQSLQTHPSQSQNHCLSSYTSPKTTPTLGTHISLSMVILL